MVADREILPVLIVGRCECALCSVGGCCCQEIISVALLMANGCDLYDDMLAISLVKDSMLDPFQVRLC